MGRREESKGGEKGCDKKEIGKCKEKQERRLRREIVVRGIKRGRGYYWGGGEGCSKLKNCGGEVGGKRRKKERKRKEEGNNK